MSISEAAKYAGASPRTLKRWFDKGLPKYQAGPREKVLVRREDIDRLLMKEKDQIDRGGDASEAVETSQ